MLALIRTAALAAVIMLLTALTTPLAAQSYPQRAITLVVPFPAGGPADGFARVFASALQARVGQPIVVDNRAGGGTMVGVMGVARAEPDGYTLTLGVSALTIQPTINPKLNFNPVRDITPITLLVEPVQAIVVAPKLGVKSIAELIALAKQKPDTLTFASTGQGTATHIGGEYFAQTAGIKIVHVPYPGSSPALVDMLGGRVDMLVDAVSGSLAYAAKGELVILATTGAKRSAVTPDVPLVKDTLPGFESRSFIGLFGPKGLPQDITNLLHKASAEALADPEVTKRVGAIAMDVIADGPETFAQIIARDTEKWRKIMLEAGIIK